MASGPNDPTDFSQKAAWQAEIDRSRRVAEPYWQTWEHNLLYYQGQSVDGVATQSLYVSTQANPSSYVNVNADFTNCEVKLANLFYSTPELQLSAKGEFKTRPPAAVIPGAPPPQVLPGGPIVAAHRELLNELLGVDHVDVLPTIQKVIKDCLVTAGVGVTKIGYTATMQSVEPPQQLGAVLGLSQPTQRPVDEQFYWERVPSKKFRIPADFADTDFDNSPWVGMEFRMPLAQARRLFNLPDDVVGTTERDTKILTGQYDKPDVSSVPYVDGVEIWYQGYIFDQDVLNPKVIRRHVILEGVDGFVEKTNENPFQTLLPTGRLSADSMIGYPIHVLAIRTVPDSAFVPSDSTMTRPLVRELCRFRTQQVQERDANIPRMLYDSGKLTPDTIQKIVDGTVGSMIPVEEDALQNGVDKIMAQVAQGTQTRGSYTANDYIQRDLDKTLGIDAIGSGIKDNQSATATEIGVVDRQRSARLDSERRQVLAWYIKGVKKFSALVCRYMTPQMALPYLGQTGTQMWAQWDKRTWDGRMVFDAKPDSQIKLDGASERKFALDIYQFLAKDPHVNRVMLLKNLLEKANLDAADIVVEQLPQQKPDLPAISFAFKGEDLLGPQAQQVREILAQGGVQISPEAVQASATQLFQQMTLGIRDASGKAVAPSAGPQQHGGTTDKVRPLDQQSADLSGQRTGPKTAGGRG